MEIRKSELSDLPAMEALYAAAREFMREMGNPDQWGTVHPPAAQLISDIEQGRSYLCLDEGKAVGCFYFGPGPDPAYLTIEGGSWLSDSPYWVVHRVAAAGRRGVGTFCLRYCMERANHIRIDTHEQNLPMQRMLLKNGFSRRGIIHLANSDERVAFEWLAGMAQ